MTTIRVTHDLHKIAAIVDNVRNNQLPFAAAKALTLTAKAAQAKTLEEIAARIDRPTPTLMKGLFIKPATKRDLTAMVYVKDRPLGGKNPYSLAEVLRHQFGGGTRISKVLELALRRAGLISGDEFVAPGAGAKLDQYGNMSRGQIGQILSQIGVGGSGYDNRSTKSARSRRNVAKAGKIFWSRGQGSLLKERIIEDFVQHLPKGAWMRVGRGLKPLLIVVRQPRYGKRIDMDRIARDTAASEFPRLFEQSFREAVATAR